jgi:hypothetical protein
MSRGRRPAADRLPRRGTDRLEDLAAWVLMTAAVVLLVVTVVVGFGGYAAAAAVAREQAADRTEVVATAVADAPFVASGLGTSTQRVLAEVTWTDVAGLPRSGRALVPSLTRAGQQVSIWVDGAGQPVAEPPPAVEAALGAVGLAVCALAGGWLVLFAGWQGVRRFTTTLNDRAWDREWARIGPEWTGHGGDRRRNVGGRPAD